ncbi:MAG: branched-chain amino acid transaminase [bacterium]|nr:branched-chain amino acid transaminase [bacterium]
MNIGTTPYIWQNGTFVRWENAKTHVLSHALHYGSSVFEGIRVYPTGKGPALRLVKDHVARLFYSASTMRMKIPFTQSQIFKAIVETVRKNKLNEKGYVRPLAYYGYGKMGVNPVGAEVNLIIACWPWPTYLADTPIAVKISKFIRIHPKSCFVDAKVCGYYVNNIFAIQDVVGPGCDEALLLDFKGNIAEGPGENFFIVKKGIIYTPPLGTILKGITRRTVIDLARKLGYRVVEKDIKPRDAYAADEAFFTGTAAEVTAIGSIDGHSINKKKTGPIVGHLKKEYLDLVTGKSQKLKNILTYV